MTSEVERWLDRKVLIEAAGKQTGLAVYCCPANAAHERCGHPSASYAEALRGHGLDGLWDDTTDYVSYDKHDPSAVKVIAQRMGSA